MNNSVSYEIRVCRNGEWTVEAVLDDEALAHAAAHKFEAMAQRAGYTGADNSGPGGVIVRKVEAHGYSRPGPDRSGGGGQVEAPLMAAAISSGPTPGAGRARTAMNAHSIRLLSFVVLVIAVWGMVRVVTV